MAQDPAENEDQAPLTAGQRLAAQQAAKAARKAAQRGRDAELVEEKAIAQAVVAKDWLADNLKPLGMMAGGVLLVAAVGIGWATFTHGQNAKAGEALAAVLEGDADEPADLSTAYANVADSHAKTAAAAWARIGQGKALYAQGEFESARAAYQAALEASEDETIRWAALEGLSYSFEAESAYGEALEQLEALRAVNRSIAPIAGYHQGRILVEQGKLDEAKTKFDWVLNELKESDAPALPYTQEQAEARLALIDPSLAPAAGSDPRQTEEIIRQMNEMLQRQPPQE
ncbi:MAG: tetratricopeptide repeat protein [Myxococcales bacterium]|nr:tetratricopeptide repeat protein [Myxococcales bacterium]